MTIKLKTFKRLAREKGYQVHPQLGWNGLVKLLGGPADRHLKTQRAFLKRFLIDENPQQATTVTKPKAPYQHAMSEKFLASYEWRKVRMLALKKYGARCQCCGATPADGVMMHVDHIKPRAVYPELALSLSNLQILCEVCNHGKGNWDMTDWREQEAHIRAVLNEDQ